MFDLLQNEYVVMIAVIVAPFVLVLFRNLLLLFSIFLRKKLPVELHGIIDEVARRGMAYAEQVAKTTNVKREEKMDMAVSAALRYAKQKYGIEPPRVLIIEAIEYFLGLITLKSSEIIEGVTLNVTGPSKD